MSFEQFVLAVILFFVLPYIFIYPIAWVIELIYRLIRRCKGRAGSK